MEIQLEKVAVQRTARVYSLGTPGPQVRHIWFALHGYGQLASFFARHFRAIAAPDTLIVIPEGLSRFYLDPQYDRVGASWMTREDRLDEIADYVRYLDDLYAGVAAACTGSPELHLLGFSQGAATAWRWFRQGQVDWDELVLWAGQPPEEQDPLALSRLRSLRLHWVVGEEDEYFSPERAAELGAGLRALHPALQVHSFPGKHTMHADTLRRIARLS